MTPPLNAAGQVVRNRDELEVPGIAELAAPPHVSKHRGMIINSIRECVGVNGLAMRGERVVVIAVHRGDSDHGEFLLDDAAIGELQPEDMLECVQIYLDRAGVERTTWVRSDAHPWELGPGEGRRDGPIETTIVVTRRTWME